ncbi:DUF4304 domain-containing protein [bacterium]|nr:MAG: DUF4304 domain-containing protein [bacterium]
MIKTEINKLITCLLIPCGFKRNGNYWYKNLGQICQIINLQKSVYGNIYYINWGYKFLNVSLTNSKFDIFYRVSIEEKGHIDADKLSVEQVNANVLTAINKIITEFANNMSETELMEHLKQDKRKQNELMLSVKKFIGIV